MKPLTTKQAAKILSIQSNTVANYCAQPNPKLRAEKVNNAWMIDPDSVYEFKRARDAAPNDRKRKFNRRVGKIRDRELERNRELMAERIQAAKVTKAVYLNPAGDEVSRREWLGK